MTAAEMKKLDRRIMEVKDPFGAGLPILRKIFEEWAGRSEIAESDLVRQYMGWKWSKG